MWIEPLNDDDDEVLAAASRRGSQGGTTAAKLDLADDMADETTGQAVCGDVRGALLLRRRWGWERRWCRGPQGPPPTARGDGNGDAWKMGWRRRIGDRGGRWRRVSGLNP